MTAAKQGGRADEPFDWIYDLARDARSIFYELDGRIPPLAMARLVTPWLRRAADLDMRPLPPFITPTPKGAQES